MSQLSGAQDSSRVLQHLLTGQRVATPAMGEAPLEGIVVSATATECVVTIDGFSSEATFTAKYTTQWVAGVAQIPSAGTACLVAFPPNSPTKGPWVIAFFGQGSAPGSVPMTIGTSAGAPTTGSWVAGQQWIDTNDVLWVCTVSGTPGTWRLTNPPYGAGSAVVGSYTLGTPVFEQSGTEVVTTNAAGGWSFLYPRAFPNGVLSAVAWLGDNGNPGFITGQQVNMTTAVLAGLAYSSASTVIANTAIRIDWIAKGF